MKRILVFTTQLMQTGGIESHILEFCDHMSASGINITLVVPNFQMNVPEEARLRKACKQVYFNKGKAGARTMGWLFATGIKIGAASFDALYTNGQGESIGIFAGLIWRKKHWVHHHHTAGDTADQASWGSRYRASLLKAGNIIACSFKNAGDMQHALQRSIDVVPCFSRKIIVSQKVTREDEKMNFGYYGRLVKEKGIDLLCKLSDDKDCHKIQFHIWGEGNDYPHSFFDKFPRLQYHGTFKGLDGLRQVIEKLDAFLLVSTHPEGLPVCLLEAMGAGLPWLATNKGGISDIAIDPLSTRVIEDNLGYAEIKKNILNLYNDLVGGKIDFNNQVRMYNEKFAAAILVKQWSNVLRLSPAGTT